MKMNRRLLAALLCAVFLAGVLGACTGETEPYRGTEDENLATDSATPQEKAETQASDAEASAAIVLSDAAVKVTGSGAETDGSVVTITKGGTYSVTGSVTDGRIVINAPQEDVCLLLEGVDVTCSYGSPIYIYKSASTTIELAENTTNTLTDGDDYTFADSLSSATEEEPNACLYSKSDLVITGTGELIVNANFNNGITGKDTLVMESATVTVTAANHGINGKDSCTVKDASIHVTCGGDALRSTNDTDTTLGYIVIENTNLELTAGEDGIQAETALSMDGGTCYVMSGGSVDGTIADDASAKGLKAGTSLSLSGGSYTLDCCDDAIHSNGSVLISGGTYTIATADDGIHADESTTITDGTITIERSYEGIEGTTVAISGGAIDIVSSDDGINAAGGTDQSGFGPRQDNFMGNSDCNIDISGGVITVNASGDGVDSNGSLTVSGGELYISGPPDNGNGAIDYDSTATITGGIVVAVGASGMAQNFGNGSTQGSILLSYPTASSETVTLKDSEGNMLLTYTPEKAYSCVLISCPSITAGDTYTVLACGQNSSVTMDTLQYGSAGMGGGNRPGMPGNGGNPPEMPGNDGNQPGGPGDMGGRGGRP